MPTWRFFSSLPIFFCNLLIFILLYSDNSVQKRKASPSGQPSCKRRNPEVPSDLPEEVKKLVNFSVRAQSLPRKMRELICKQGVEILSLKKEISDTVVKAGENRLTLQFKLEDGFREKEEAYRKREGELEAIAKEKEAEAFHAKEELKTKTDYCGTLQAAAMYQLNSIQQLEDKVARLEAELAVCKKASLWAYHLFCLLSLIFEKINFFTIFICFYFWLRKQSL